MNKPLTAAETLEFAKKRKAAAPELAKQARKRVRRAPGAKIHMVERDIKPPSRLQEAATIHEIDHAPEERNWKRASALPAIAPPPGYVVKYVRIDHSQRGDEQNLARHIEEGWVICRKSDFPGRSLPSANLTSHGDYIGNRNTILCKLSERMVAQRNRYFNERRDQATRGIDTDSGLLGEVKRLGKYARTWDTRNENSASVSKDDRKVSRAGRTGRAIEVPADE